MIELPRFIEERFERQAALLDRVEAALAEHLPAPLEGQESNENEALELLYTWADRFGRYRVLNRDAEREKLAEIQRAAGLLARLWRGLDPKVSRMLDFAGSSHDGLKLETYMTTSKLGSLSQIVALPERIKKARPAAERVIAEADPAGKMNWRAASLVGECRDLWKRRTGREAPRTEPKHSSKFLPFLEAVLAAFDAGRPIPAFRAWMRAHR